MKLIAGLLAAVFGGGTATAAVPDGVAIAPLDEALSFARIAGADGPRVLAVREYAGGQVTAVDLGTVVGEPAHDPIALFEALGYAALRDRIVAAKERVVVSTDMLIQPVDLTAHHVAVGTNYPAHADESGVEDGPFLFPKTVVPTGPHAPVSVAGRLLDYEVELCWVTLQPLRRKSRPEHWGLMLCNDYTDRASLLRHLDPDNVASGQGFTTGKSFEGALPVGDLFVIPGDARAFAADIDLRLYRNGEMRQQSLVQRAVWDIDAILRETWARADTTWESRGEQVSLFKTPGTLPARTLILSGTPDGTIFAGITLGQKLRGVWRWFGSGLDGSLPASVIRTYIDEARAAGGYLRPGETVLIRSDWLGRIENPVVP
ncbi:MAG: fumarylacetoacetate hydrolase family protein [Sinimarinibacterium sp.]|jgi:2-keto-4-pentenoate hydratase/2-oxohepta-3-ene-1,7-dioic acid hydratase in catechol pathway